MKHFLISRFSLPTRVTDLPSLLFYYSPATFPASLYLPLALVRQHVHTAACLGFLTLFSLVADNNKGHYDCCHCSCRNREHYLLIQITSNLHHRLAGPALSSFPATCHCLSDSSPNAAACQSVLCDFSRQEDGVLPTRADC